MKDKAYFMVRDIISVYVWKYKMRKVILFRR